MATEQISHCEQGHPQSRRLVCGIVQSVMAKMKSGSYKE